MIFNSWVFAIFFVVVYLLYLQLKHREQNRMLLVASYFFYGLWDPRFLLLVLASTVVDYYVGIAIENEKVQDRKRRILWISMAANLGFLGFFKYFDFFAGNLEAMLNSMGFQVSPLTLGIIVPVGISFYTFQTMSYTIDVYRGEIKACRKFEDFALFVAFFPQLVAGPIERAGTLIGQVQAPRILTEKNIQIGIWFIMKGYFMKVLVADNVAALADEAFAAQKGLSGAYYLIGTYAFAIQIYCDFAGYSSIARGISQLMGFSLMENFRAPYIATSPSEFWKRWHISLSTWLRDYLYIPLGGNRQGGWFTYRNLMITMLLGGFWHGAEWKFILWGLYQGTLLILFRAFGPSKPLNTPIWLKPVQILAYFQFTCFGWLIFRCQSISQVGNWMQAILTDFRWTNDETYTLAVLAFLFIPVCLMDYFEEQIQDAAGWLQKRAYIKWPAYAAMFALVFIFGSRGGAPFIYFQF